MWASTILVGMFYVFGICLTQGVVDHMQVRDAWEDSSSEDLLHYFGTLERSALSLFQAMSGGMDWDKLFQALSPLGFQYRLVLIAFVLFDIFGAANVVTGIFVEIANRWAHNDTWAQVQTAEASRRKTMQQLHELWMEQDVGGYGTLTLELMYDAFLDTNIGLVSKFSGMGLELTDVRTLFLLLDRDQKGFINMQDFLLGCFRLKGRAKTLDLVKLQYQTEWIMHTLEGMHKDPAESEPTGPPVAGLWSMIPMTEDDDVVRSRTTSFSRL